ncbi:MAG: cupin domain-containing protein [Paracoccaceae bacterium]
MELAAADFQSPLPVQNYHVYFEDEALGLSVGIWDTTTMQEAFGPYPTDEFILVIQGAFAMIDGKGGAVAAQAGDSVCFHQGVPTSWKQDGYLRKIYLTLADPKADMPIKGSADGGVVVLRQPALGERDTLFCNESGTMQVHYIAPGGFRQPNGRAQGHELVQVLTGHIEVIEPSGEIQLFRPGQVFFIPRGTMHALAGSEDFAAYRVSVWTPEHEVN